MWTNQTQTDVPGSSPAGRTESATGHSNAKAANRPPNLPARPVTCLGATLEFTGKISGQEDLQIEGKVDGPISLQGHRLMVGPTGNLNSEIIANEVIVHGKITGNLHVRDRVEIKNGGAVFGDITTARISIDEGADFKGRAEIERPKPQPAAHSGEAVVAVESD
jgi:cytoskeletal protein CcmA (bactofilin family)